MLCSCFVEPFRGGLGDMFWITDLLDNTSAVKL